MRRLLLLVLAGLAIWLMRRIARVAEPRVSHAAPAVPAAPRFEGAMVRDRICQTFLPRSRALAVLCEEEEHFFCSEDCRTAFLERRRTARAPR